MRKPRDFMNPWAKSYSAAYLYGKVVVINLDHEGFTAVNCRKLAAWLIKAADWLDHQASVKKKRGS